VRSRVVLICGNCECLWYRIVVLCLGCGLFLGVSYCVVIYLVMVLVFSVLVLSVCILILFGFVLGCGCSDGICMCVVCSSGWVSMLVMLSISLLLC